LIIKEWPNELREKLENIKIDKFYLASLDNPIAHSIFNPSFMRLFTFDDGSTSIIAPNMYTRYTDRVVGPKEITLERVINLSQAHYTKFDTNTVFPTEKLIKIPFDKNYRKIDAEGIRKDGRSIILCSPSSYSKCRKC